ncbi:ABC transporter ATP-binding protein [Erythrobacter sp. YT30]|uniref:ABC transporter ATP-binding protein n=1 Tax=Erythrobacter sp. YT30 TaxID=1735012 RepID=UPI00076DDC0E|nr:ABC transporter ATP-binding protein [Erythrobacter sp. YT30]KWV93280.1 ferrichrome ABC transporter ATP-binding protein [Erythrobacter sp. YT30]
MSALTTENLSLSRGGKRVLSDITTTFQPGQITAIVGPNGAGKSSLLMACAGLLHAEAGRVQLAGEPISSYPHKERAKALGYLPQSGEIAWDVTVEALVALGRMPHGDARSDQGKQAINTAITALDCDTLRHRRAHQLSGGEQGRVLLARVLAGEPQFILADEPLAALDLSHQMNLVAHFKACAARGMGVIMVLHDLALAMNHADRVLVLDEGRVASDGAPQTALSAQVIADVWNVEAQWTGEQYAKALIISN